MIRQEIHRWCHTRCDRVPQKEIQLCGVYIFIHQQDLRGTTNRKDFEIWYWQHRARFLSAWLDPNQAVGLRSKRFAGALVLENKPCRRWKAAPVPTWKASWAVYVSLSHSNRPLVVYWKTEEVMLSIRLDTRCSRVPSGSAFTIAFWKTTQNAWGHRRSKYNSQINLHFWYYTVTSTGVETLLNMEPEYKKQYIKLHRSISGFYWRLKYKWDLIMVCHSPMTWCIRCGWY